MRSHAFLISFGLASLTGCSALVGIEDATLRTSTGGSAGAAGSAVAGTAGSAGGGAASGAAGAVAGRGGSGGEAGNTGGMGGGGGKTDAGSGGIAGAAGIGGAGNAGNGGAGNAGSGGGGNAGSGGAGTGGSAGAGNGGAGAAGSAGSSGANAGNGGAAGIGGGGAGGAVQGGAAGNAGQAGNAGNAGTAGSAGTAGNGGSAGSGAVTITSFGTGIQHACAARSDGSLWCWGANVHGQLGSGQPGGKSVPAKVALQDVAAVAVGITHTCALAKNGDLRCWGENGGGQCGLGFETPSVTTPPVNPILKNVSAVYSASRGTTCAVQNDQVLCWGRRLDGQSSGGNSHTSTPTVQTGLRSGTVHRVSVGSEVGCALIGDRVQCWGRGGPGVGAGPGVPNAYFPPADIVKPTSALAGVHVGDLSALAWTASGELFAWGGNGNKQLGFDGPNDGTPQAVIVSAGLDAPVVAAASGFRSSCAIGGVDRRVRCWGGNGHGQIGASLGPGGEYLPSKNVLFQDGGSLAPLSAHAIDVGWEEACATSVDRERMYCWGAGESGQLGDGTIGDSTIAVPVALP